MAKEQHCSMCVQCIWSVFSIWNRLSSHQRPQQAQILSSSLFWMIRIIVRALEGLPERERDSRMRYLEGGGRSPKDVHISNHSVATDLSSDSE